MLRQLEGEGLIEFLALISVSDLPIVRQENETNGD